jgi:hypothetical protein
MCVSQEMIMDFSHTPDTGAGPDPPGSGGYVSARWADWTVLPAINVVNDALFTGAVRETPCLEPVYTQSHQFTKTGS